MSEHKLQKLILQYRSALKNQGFFIAYRKFTDAVKIYGQYRLRLSEDGVKRTVVPSAVPMQFDAVNLDINNTCNLRCKFCFNRFTESPVYMDEETFRRILPILDYTRDSRLYDGMGFYFSCLYEPTVAPNFLKLLAMLPKQGRKKAFLTTNMCRSLSEKDMKQILRANIHHINISIETLKKERYQEICGSVQFDSFRDNLHRLGEVYSRLIGRKAKLRFISMVLKANMDELPELINFCHTTFGKGVQSELRTPFPGVYSNMEWNSRQFLNREDCLEFEKRLKEMPYKKIWNLQPEEEMPPVTKEMLQAAKDAAVSEIGELDPMNQEYFFVRVSPAGMIHFNGLNETVCSDKAEVDKAFYYRKLKQLYERRNAYFYLGEGIFAHFGDVPGKPKLSSCTRHEMSLELRGILSVPEPYASCEWRLICHNKDQQAEFLLHKTPCTQEKYRFYCCIANNRLRSKRDYLVRIVFYRDSLPMGECAIAAAIAMRRR